MKHVTSILLIASTFLAAEIHGQGFVYLSNTNQTAISSNSIVGGVYIPFRTGSNAPGYSLDSVSVLFASNTPVVMTAAVYDYGSRTYLYFQTATSVSSAGYYTFTPNTLLPLAAATSYLMEVLPADPLGNLPNWNFITSSAVTSVDNWSASLTEGAPNPLFSISATPFAPAPEPAALSLICLGALVFILFRRRTSPNQSLGPTTITPVRLRSGFRVGESQRRRGSVLGR